MALRSFWDVLPPPRFLDPPAFGLDISDRSAKFFQLSDVGSGCRIENFGELDLPLGLIEAGQIKKPEELTATLKRLNEEFGLRWVFFDLPEELAYIIRLHLPPMARSELRSSIELQLEEHIPLKPTEVIFDYEIITGPHQASASGFDLVVSVFPAATIEQYYQVLQSAGLAPLACEIESHAISRSLFETRADETVLIIDFGGTRTSFFVVEKGYVLFTSTINQIGGREITLSIQRHLGLDFAAAERLKIEQGLLRGRRGEEVRFGVMPIVSVLRDELMKLVNYWTSHEAAAGGGRPVSKIILCGGQSTLPGLVEYLTVSTARPVELGNVWTRVCDLNKTVPPISFNQAQRYAAAIGLALRRVTYD